MLVPLRFDMILLVCCFSLFVCDLNLWAYKARDILVEDNPSPIPSGVVTTLAAGVMGTEKLPLLFWCWPMLLVVACGWCWGWCWLLKLSGVLLRLEAAVKASTFSWKISKCWSKSEFFRVCTWALNFCLLRIVDGYLRFYTVFTWRLMFSA